MWRVSWSVSATRERTREQKKEDSQVKKKISLHIVNQKNWNTRVWTVSTTSMVMISAELDFIICILVCAAYRIT